MANELFSVKDKVIVITGGTGILGGCMSKHFAAEGAKVAILGRNKDAGDKLVGEIKNAGNEASFFQTDVLNKAVLEQNCKDIVAKYSTIDVLVNCAGGNMPGAVIPPDKTFFDLQIDDFRQVVDLNLQGTVIPTLVFAKVMVENKKGNIINISSESAMRPLTRVAGYGAAKAAVTNFTKWMCGELAIKFGEGFRVNALAPGFFLTEQNRALMTNTDGSLTARGKAVVAHTPFGRFGKPEELLGAMQWLASDASSFVSGSVVVVDGGFDAFSI